MSAYFDPSAPADLALLNADVRSDSELANVAAATEDDVRQFYTVWDDREEEYVVKLRGYTADPAQAGAAFKKAYKQTIADAISFRLLNYNNRQGVKSESRGQRSQEYFDGFRAQELPERIFWRLELYSTVPQPYGI